MALGDNNYYDNSEDIILPATTAEASDIENKHEGVSAGFTAVETDMDKRISLSNVDNTNYDIPDAIGVRASKMLGFDSSGELGLQVRRGTFKGDWTATTFYYQDDLMKDTTDALGSGVDSIFVATVNHTSSADLATDTANWALVLSGDDFLRITGGTLTGDLFISSGSSPRLYLKPTGMGFPSLVIQDSVGEDRCRLEFHESSGSVQLRRNQANGALDTYLELDSSGNVSVIGGDGIPTDADHLTRKDYVDDADALAMLLDGSRDMTGDLVVNHGASPTITIEPTSTGYPAYNIKDSSGVLRGVLFFSESSGELTLRRMSTIGTTQTSLVLTSDGNVYPNAVAPTNNAHLTRKDYVDAADALKFDKTGGDISGNTTIGSTSNVNRELKVLNSTGGVRLQQSASDAISLTRVDSAGVFVANLLRNTGAASGLALYYAGISKAQTVSDGFSVSGTLSADSVNAADGATGSFTTSDAKTVTVTNGIITSIV